jgi:hypothetical protein
MATCVRRREELVMSNLLEPAQRGIESPDPGEKVTERVRFRAGGPNGVSFDALGREGIRGAVISLALVAVLVLMLAYAGGPYLR